MLVKDIYYTLQPQLYTMHKKVLPVDIVFSVRWKVIVYDQRHLLDINTSGLRRIETYY